ncbi:SMEK domain-containing protein [Clostridium sp. VAP23]|uniref:SMEK domain-containing protein n=1 Tax=Clostridium sp. VAP23 TaxID=2949981 RepID=UPI0020799F70
MEKSDKRIQFITDYISAYEEKIKILNVNGLFDTAKLFELFAIEVGSLYFGQGFSNLNVDTYTYPCVDLISNDKKIYIQVSTSKDIPTKIKRTLENIRDSKKTEISTLTNVKFFMLNNDSVNKVKDYKGNEQIGNISFNKENDLITTKDILQRAINDFDFQIKLYNLFKRDVDSIKDNIFEYKEAIENSKRIGLADIDCKINNEYEIDRGKLIAKIKKDNNKNISIQGGAGSGKSVLCKKIIEGKENIIYARAERFLEESDINNIWGFNVRKTLKYLNGKPIIFFIDSLEFIADNRTKFELLSVLYECTKNYPAARIITSCRTSDKNAFIKIESKYSVSSYDVPELSIDEQLAIARKYSIIRKMLRINSYAQLLKSPFYINLIVSKIDNINDIFDENELREYIWKHIICLDKSEIKQVVESIVFTRAKEFSLGAISTDYDTDIIKELVSKGILIRNDKTVRLKYDIFEDICFEQDLDSKFDKCRGKYNEFFGEIETFGRCIYRRYQIWISNKLFAKNNREKFLYQLVFSNQIPQKWRKQTEIGLVKSRYCGEFFSEYGQKIITNGMFNEFVKITNLYAFEIKKDSLLKYVPYIQLKPSGKGRASLINLIVENKLYEKDDIIRLDLEKICSDYSKSQSYEKQTAEEACTILEYFIDKCIAECKLEDYYNLDNIVEVFIAPIYQMAEYSINWIKEFWERLSLHYKCNNRSENRFAENIIGDALKFKHIKLAKYLPTELCKLAELLWIDSNTINNGDYLNFYERSKDEISYKYGLSKKAEEYEHKVIRNTVINSNFFYMLFRENFWIGLNWAISFINKAVVALQKKNKGYLPIFEINFIDSDIKRSYMGIADMWLSITEEDRIPMVIGDLIYCLKEVMQSVIKNDVVENEETAKFAENVKKVIYEKSNNIALLTIIANIGMEFRDKLPGYALDLATNIYIIRNDLTRFSLLIKNPSIEVLEKQMLMSVGIPYPLPNRYIDKNKQLYNLLDYVRDSQIFHGKEIKEKSYKILNYLYSIVPNDKENADNYLQIQNMDLRTAKAIKVNDNVMALYPTVTGEAEKITIENEKRSQPEKVIESIIKDCNIKFSKNEFKLNDCLKTIKLFIKTRKKCTVTEVYDEFLIGLIMYALNNKDIEDDTRARLSQIWIDGINSYFSMQGIIFKYNYSWILFSQLETDVCDDIKKQIKKLILDLILYKGQNGVIDEIGRYAKLYLRTNKQLARAMFNTIFKLAEDEMNHQKFNARYIDKYRKKEKFVFIPNGQPKLSGVERFIKMDKREKYKSRKNEIIKEYLFNDIELDLSNFDIDNYDITTLCYAINCGLSIKDTDFSMIVRKLVITMINIWKINDNLDKILGVYPLYEVVDFFQKEIVESDTNTTLVLEILFTDIDFSSFTHKTIEFYLEVFGSLLSEYFDSYNDKVKRAYCEKIIRLLESRIIKIKDERVKVELYKSLTLYITRYGGCGDWTKCPSGYSYQDKQFLNDLFSKYGEFHLQEILDTIYKLHLDKLLPEILLSVRDLFKNVPQINKTRRDTFTEIIRKRKVIVLTIITKAFLDFSNEIKQDDDLTDAFEDILEMLVRINYEEAATILDEFRVH